MNKIKSKKGGGCWGSEQMYVRRATNIFEQTKMVLQDLNQTYAQCQQSQNPAYIIVYRLVEYVSQLGDYVANKIPLRSCFPQDTSGFTQLNEPTYREHTMETVLRKKIRHFVTRKICDAEHYLKEASEIMEVAANAIVNFIKSNPNCVQSRPELLKNMEDARELLRYAARQTLLQKQVQLCPMQVHAGGSHHKKKQQKYQLVYLVEKNKIHTAFLNRKGGCLFNIQPITKQQLKKSNAKAWNNIVQQFYL
jgi:excinuclease UvrABC nuclease subunit